MNLARENILSCIRENLSDIGVPATEIREHHTVGITEDHEVLVNRFIGALEKAGGQVIRCHKENLSAELAKIFSSTDTVWIEPHRFLQEIRPEGFSVGNDPAQCTGALTTCEALIAETGTVMITRSEYRQRVTSLIVGTHCVVVCPDQIISTLDDFLLQRKKSDPEWIRGTSVLTLITGPSRTADIEKVLIQGMHGPRKLVVIVIEG